MSRLLFVAFLLICTSCDSGLFSLERQNLYKTKGILETGFTRALIEGEIIDVVDGGQIEDYGHCWSATNTTPTTSDSLTTFGTRSDLGSFVSELLNLEINTEYFVRMYVVVNGETLYGDVISFTTQTLTKDQLPVVTNSVFNITALTAEVEGNIKLTGEFANLQIVSYGHIWGTDADVNFESAEFDSSSITVALVAGQENVFTTFMDLQVSGIFASTYYVRTYAELSDGRYVYGNVLNFSLL